MHTCSVRLQQLEKKKTKNQQTNQVQRYRKSNKEIAKPKLETKQNETNNKSIVNW